MAKRSIKAFVAIPFALSDVRQIVTNLVDRMPPFSVLDWTEQMRPGVSLLEAVREQIRNADLVIVDVSTANANVSSEAGISFALGKAVVVIVRKGRPVPHHFSEFKVLEYSNLLQLERGLFLMLEAFRTGKPADFAPKPRGQPPTVRRKLRLQDMPGEPATRVFVGGNYREQFAIVLELANFANTIRPWTAIVANDFEMAKDHTRKESLRLLYMCDYAMFDVTSDGGQFIEIENAQQFGIDFLLVYNTMDASSPSHVSSMVPRGAEAVPYTGLDKLRDIVEKWLERSAT